MVQNYAQLGIDLQSGVAEFMDLSGKIERLTHSPDNANRAERRRMEDRSTMLAQVLVFNAITLIVDIGESLSRIADGQALIAAEASRPRPFSED